MATAENPPCAARVDDLAALAVGALTGRERAELLAHLEECPTCSAELDTWSGAFDALTTLFPEESPPTGFADRVTARMRADRATQRRPLRRRIAIAVAIVTFGLGIGLGSVLASSAGRGSGEVRAALTSHSGAWGTVLIEPGRHSWLIMKIEDAEAIGPVTCEVTMTDGSHHMVGRFHLDSGYGTWAAQLPVTSSEVRSVTVRDLNGRTVATAQLPA